MEIYKKALDWLADGRSFALATVIYAQGSTPQKAGSKALLDEAGNLAGTLGGGLVEAQGLEKMRQAIADKVSCLHEFRLDEEYSRSAGPICGGVMRFLTDPNVERNAQTYRSALDAIANGQRGALITNLSLRNGNGGEAIWSGDIASASDPSALPTMERIDESLTSEKLEIVSNEAGDEFFVEPILPTPRLLIVGGGHVGQAVAIQAQQLGFEVTVYDDRPEFANPDLFPQGVNCAHGNLSELVNAFPKGRDTYIVLVSKGHKPDAEALEACIGAEVAYLGMIGSERKIRFLRKSFIEDKLASPEQFDRVVAPIGYEIGAVTVPEIAVSIAAQLVAARRRPSSIRDVNPKAL